MTEQVITDQGKLLIKNALVHFRNNPEKHQQGEWICQTGCCLAGDVVLAVGAEPIYAGVQFGTTKVFYQGRERIVPALATEVLGITDADAYSLFDSGNTIETLEAMYGLLDAGHHLARRCPHCRTLLSTPEVIAVLGEDYDWDCGCRDAVTS